NGNFSNPYSDGNILYGTNPEANVLYGTTGDDLIHAGSGDDTIYGDNGNDTVWVGTGANSAYGTYIDGGDGIDTVNFGDATTHVTVDLASGIEHHNGIAYTYLSNIENVTGSRYDDLISDD